MNLKQICCNISKKINLPNMLSCFRTNTNRKDLESNYQPKTNEEIFFLKNGAAVLEQIVISFNGNCNPIRNYTKKELNEATNDFHQDMVLFQGVNYNMYKGVHEDRKVSVKKFVQSYSDQNYLGAIANEVAIASQMSKHKNVLKLLGCCLETETPMLVYEFPENGNLFYHRGVRSTEPLPWETKLRIAMEIANAVAYLHHGFSKTFIHRDIKPSNIYLDQDFVAKLFDFRFSMPIPEGKTHVQVDSISWSYGFVDPEVLSTLCYTERSDVYSFGVLLCELFTEKSYLDLLGYLDPNGNINTSNSERGYWYAPNGDYLAELCKNYLKANILQEGNDAQVMECGKLVQKCINKNADDWPNMVEVAKTLRFIRDIKQ